MGKIRKERKYFKFNVALRKAKNRAKIYILRELPQYRNTVSSINTYDFKGVLKINRILPKITPTNPETDCC